LLSGLVFATPTTKVLLVEPLKNKVIELDGTGTLVWEYGGEGVLDSPREAIPLTNGNILIADSGNKRIVEVTPNGTIERSLTNITGSAHGTFTPLDVRKCVNYVAGPYYGSDTLLICDTANKRVIEVTYPGGEVIWEYKLGIFFIPAEAEKRPGAGTATYLITDKGGAGKVIVVERTDLNNGDIKWEYSVYPQDASWTPCGNVLIVRDSDVIEVKPTGFNTGEIVGTITPNFNLREAIRIPDGNILVAGYKRLATGAVATATVAEFQTMTNTVVWEYATATSYGGGFVDVELKGIINVAKIEYKNEKETPMKPTLAGIIVPILPLEINNPLIVATKTVLNQKPEYTVGDVIEYKIEYTNTGEGTATNVTIIDQIPEGTEFVENSMTGPGTYEYSYDGGETYGSYIGYTGVTGLSHIRWTIGTIGPGEGGEVGFKVKVK